MSTDQQVHTGTSATQTELVKNIKNFLKLHSSLQPEDLWPCSHNGISIFDVKNLIMSPTPNTIGIPDWLVN